LMFSTCHDQKVPTKDFCPSVSQSLRHITDTKNPCVLVLTRCHVTDINHVLTPCHVIEINYDDRGVAARTPLQSRKQFVSRNTGFLDGLPKFSLFFFLIFDDVIKLSNFQFMLPGSAGLSLVNRS